jgi:hypothetical protein
MEREKPLDLAVVQAWLSAWNERDILTYRRHAGGGPRTVQPSISTHEADDTCTNSPASRAEADYAVHGDHGRFQIHTEKRQGEEGIPGKRDGQSVGSRQRPSFFLKCPLARSRRSLYLSVNFGARPV